MPWYTEQQVEKIKRDKIEAFKMFLTQLVMSCVFILILTLILMREVNEKRQLQSECIRLGYGERDTDGNFVLKNGKNCTPE